jgi:hypothetical protein
LNRSTGGGSYGAGRADHDTDGKQNAPSSAPPVGLDAAACAAEPPRAGTSPRIQRAGLRVSWLDERGQQNRVQFIPCRWNLLLMMRPRSQSGLCAGPRDAVSQPCQGEGGRGFRAVHWFVAPASGRVLESNRFWQYTDCSETGCRNYIDERSLR